MIDDRVNAEERAESRKLKEAAETATDDGMPVAPEKKEKEKDEPESVASAGDCRT
jgi:hypothetical protein